MADLFIKDKHLQELRDIFDRFCPKAVVYAYGSRVTGNAHDGSDLDMAIDLKKDDCDFFELKEAINDSNIPFLLDVIDFCAVPEYFRTEILKNNVIIYPYKN